jgi:hypothetical protein
MGEEGKFWKQVVSPSHPPGTCSRVTSSETRRAQNQELFRTGNQRLSSALSDKVSREAAVPFLCECADEFCDGRVELGLADWESVKSKPNHYVTVPGHPRSEGEIVVGTLQGYDIVRKPND